MTLWSQGLALLAAFVVTVAGTREFQKIAVRRGIVANPNFRSLHERPMPRAGGVVFASVFLFVTLMVGARSGASPEVLSALLVGGAAATLFGFADDVMNIRARMKLLAQTVLGAWVLVSFGFRPLVDVPFVPGVVDLGFSLFALVWLINLYNFMDGVDGMAASGGVFIAGAAAVALSLSGGDAALILLLVLLAACSAGFLWFNWPPARIFMGDAGSVSLGYCFGVMIVATVLTRQLSLWTWMVIFGYFAVDTTTTTTLRLLREREWYGEHRSHAYQNLARVWGSHGRVVRGVSLYHLLWLLPLTVWSVKAPETAPVAAALAVTPALLWTLRFGPLMSRT